jgi:hypothetical protein
MHVSYVFLLHCHHHRLTILDDRMQSPTSNDSSKSEGFGRHQDEEITEEVDRKASVKPLVRFISSVSIHDEGEDEPKGDNERRPRTSALSLPLQGTSISSATESSVHGRDSCHGSDHAALSAVT